MVTAADTAASQRDFAAALEIDDFHADPYPWLNSLRENDPVHHSQSLDLWIVSKHADVDAALRDYGRGLKNGDMMSRGIAMLPEALRVKCEPVARAVDGSMLSLQDPPSHARLRRVVANTFLPSRIRKLEHDVLELADEMFCRLGGETVDFVADFAAPLTHRVLSEFIGAGKENAEDLCRWSDAFIPILLNAMVTESMVDIAVAAFDEMAAFMAEQAAARAHAPTEDVIGTLVAAQATDGFSHEEILMTCVQLIFAGAHTTTTLLTSAMHTLLDNPDQLRLLRDDPKLTKGLVEEMLRYESPSRFVFRSAAADLPIRDVVIPEGATVALGLAAANRDPEVYEHPDTFDLTRPIEVNHLAFGIGPHFCVGAPLARLQAQLIVTELLQRFNDITREGAAEWKRTFDVRELAHLPLSFS
jgi:cytochrome P450